MPTYFDDMDTRPRLAVFGTRNFDDRKLMFSKLDYLTKNLVRPVVATGGQKKRVWDGARTRLVGADCLAEEWALARGYTTLVFHADAERHGYPACLHIRNREMVEWLIQRRPCFAVAFHDGESSGTRSVIALCKRHGVELIVVRY